MSTPLKWGRAGVLALIGGALLTMVAAAPASAVCVGDCSGTCAVVINNLITGVNIVLGNQPVTACPAFQNEQGEVNVAQLVRGVNNAQNGCPPGSCDEVATPTPTTDVTVPTDTPTEGVATATPTETPTTGPTATATVFQPICELKAGVCVGGNNAGQDCTANAQCSPGGGSCNFDRRCAGGPNAGQTCANDTQCPESSCPLLGDISKIELNVAALPLPLGFALTGEIRLERGPITDNQAEMACTIISIDPVNIPAIGFVCITAATEPCPGSAGTIDCDGGLPLGIDLLSDGDIGECLSNEACDTACDTLCAADGGVQQTSGCTGFCSGSAPQACSTDAECGDADNGACNGPDPVGSVANICQCQCVNTAVGDARPGDFQCQLGSSLVVESAAPCNGTDVSIAVGDACIPVTSGTAEASITNANFNPEGCPGGGPPCMLPSSGPAMNTGNPVACANYDTGPLTGAKGVGVVNFFGSALGDIVTELFAVCK